MDNPRYKGFKEITGRILYTLKRNAEQRGIVFDLTGEQLWNLFLTQDRKCALTGEILTVYSHRSGTKNTPITASLDRIDSSKDYIEGNVQWVHKDINWMKQDYTQEEFINLCKKVAKHNP